MKRIKTNMIKAAVVSVSAILFWNWFVSKLGYKTVRPTTIDGNNQYVRSLTGEIYSFRENLSK